jgi:uncharacterized protein (DUF58 family)
MRPLPTLTGAVTAAGLLLLLGLGVALERPDAVTMAGAGWVFLGMVFALTYPIGRLARASAVELSWGVERAGDARGGDLVAGTRVVLGGYFQLRGARRYTLARLTPTLPEGFTVVDDPGVALPLRPSTQTHFRVALASAASGRYVMPGLSARLEGPLGLFAVPIYFPHPVEVSILPRARPGLWWRGPKVGGQEDGRALARRGVGAELHELREHAPGDPYGAIAWKASARRGRLVVRESAEERDDRHALIVDVGPSMREGPLGARGLDAALELAAGHLSRCQREGARAALYTFSDRVIGALREGEGRTHHLRALELLLDATDPRVLDQGAPVGLGGTAALVAALEAASARRADPTRIFLLTDAKRLAPERALLDQVRASLARGHRLDVAFVVDRAVPERAAARAALEAALTALGAVTQTIYTPSAPSLPEGAPEPH